MYKVVKNLIPLEQCELISEIVKNQPLREDDGQVPNGWAYPNLPVANIMLGLLTGRLSYECGKRLLPTYSYTRLYNAGNELKSHIDRESCEWSVTINLSQTAPWPIYMNDTPITLEPGDGAIYQGNLVKHHREPFRGIETIQMFLHYVDADGPHKDHIFDIQKLKEPREPMQLRFIKQNSKLDVTHQVRGAFAKFECESIIHHFKSKILNKAGVGDGDGTIDMSVRRSRTYFIPKIMMYRWIYVRIMNIISEVNESIFHFDLSGLDENIQFTEYDSSYEGSYNWHVDFGREESSNRKLSISIQLSSESDYDGCELQVGDVKVSKEIGTAAIFPSYKLHQVSPVTRGARYSLVTWVMGPPFR
jgi:PKHD-type hydroxylase